LSFHTSCTSCNRKLVVPDRFDDRNIRCPSCSFEFKVSRASSLAAVGESDESLSDTDESETAHSKGASRRHRGHEHEEAEEDLEWDITPMVDVAFLLLIFFMLTASFSIQKAIPTSAQEEEKSSRSAVQREKDQIESFYVQIDEYNAYTIVSNEVGTQEASNKQDLILALHELKSHYGEVTPRVIIQAHMMSIHGAVVACMDAARAAGFDNLQTQTVEEFD
jgi:biopolymer transport protein ExbD